MNLDWQMIGVIVGILTPYTLAAFRWAVWAGKKANAVIESLEEVKIQAALNQAAIMSFEPRFTGLGEKLTLFSARMTHLEGNVNKALAVMAELHALRADVTALGRRIEKVEGRLQ